MPRIPDKFQNSAFFLYASTADADSGANAKGTGFVVTVPCENKALSGGFNFAVTNYHVAEAAPVPRFNLADGSASNGYASDISEWFYDRESDIAVIPLGGPAADLSEFDIQAIEADMLLTKEKQITLNIGIGDDIFMVGHFLDSPTSSKTNKPFLRFGNISRAPDEGRNLKSGEGCFMVDMRSRSGYSGSPVFVYRTLGTNLDLISKQNGNLAGDVAFITLLGMNFGGINEAWEISGEKQTTKGISGVSGVIPGWKILELLKRDDIQQKQIEAENKYRSKD